MLILALRTDNPEAELFLYENGIEVMHSEWHAHRQLAETLHSKIRELLAGHGRELAELQGIVVYKGPGSFTGLRIGISVANALAGALQVPIAGETGTSWVADGVDRLQHHKADKIVIPEYGAPVHITAQKK
jgi:tRNA threonylcarbamoyladenosine biosynthesis protein TsaB